tara:strand:- start:6912 stop:7163 length:252 start_codon:yes stop_codon:yes gene_type:complete
LLAGNPSAAVMGWRAAPGLARRVSEGICGCLQRGKPIFGLSALFAYKIASFSAAGQGAFRLQSDDWDGGQHAPAYGILNIWTI